MMRGQRKRRHDSVLNVRSKQVDRRIRPHRARITLPAQSYHPLRSHSTASGSCFPKDTLALVRTARDANAPLKLVETTVQANDARKSAMAGKVAKALGGDLAGKTIGILGLTFKPNTDDMREAPSLQIIPALQAMGAKVQAYDPAGREARQLLRDVDFKAGPYEAVEDADCAVIITEWDEFRALDLDRVKELMRRPLMVDLRNIYKTEELHTRGFTYVGVGGPGCGS